MSEKWLECCDEILELTKEEDNRVLAEQLVKILHKMNEIDEERIIPLLKLVENRTGGQ